MASQKPTPLDWNTLQQIISDFSTRPAELRAILFHAFSIKENLPLFNRFFFPQYFSSDSPEFHVEIIDEIEQPGNKGIAAPRRHAKTTLVDFGWLMWKIVYRHKHYIQLFSDTYAQSVENVNNVRDELDENELLKWVYGTQKTALWRDGEFVTSSDCKVEAKAFGIRVRGSRYKQYRPDLQIYDDMENDENVASEDQRAKRRNWLTKAAMPAMAKNGEVVYIGTILHFDSLLNNIINKVDEFASWKTKLFKALNTDADGLETSLWPAMYTVEEYKRMRDDPTYEAYMGSLAFAQEMQNQPLSDADRIFKEAWIDPFRYALAAKMAEWRFEHPDAPEDQTWITQEIIRIEGAVDPAISEKTHADYWTFATVGFDRKGEQWQLDMVRIKESDLNKQADMVIDQYEKWKHDKIKIEAVAFQAGLATLVKKKAAERGLYPPVWPVVPDKDKRRRAIIHSASFSGGLVHLRTDHELAEVFRAELLAFPLGAHDDMLDAYMNCAEDSIKKTRGRVFAKKPRGF
jgi:predicted phage terminase large subunit-like protein